MAQAVGTRRADVRPVRTHAGKAGGIMREMVQTLSSSLPGSRLRQGAGAHRMTERVGPGRHLA